MAKKGDTKDLKILPLDDHVIIKPLDGDKGEKKSAAGIIIPVTTDEDKINRGTIVAVGSGKTDNDGNLIPMNVKVGDKVMFQWGDKFTMDEEEYFMVSRSSISAIIK
jgi:chaperonin GroES